MIHRLKIYPCPFVQVKNKTKTAEFRRFDRPFERWDLLYLEEWNPETQAYTGHYIAAMVTCISTGFEIPEGYCMLSIKAVW